jgi:hypothetical protein
MPDAFANFLDNPSGDTFLELRELVLEQPEYDFHSRSLADLQDLAATGQLAAVPDELSEAMPNWLLSPRIHLLVGQAAEQRGDAETAQRELFLAQACLKGLVESGDGSRARPYRITHVADEYDLLESLGKELDRQRSVDDDPAGPLDLIVCTDGSELYFDIGPGLAKAAAAHP